MRRQLILCIVCCMSIALISCNKKEKQAQAPPPAEVSVYQTKAEDVPIFQEFVGQVYGSKDIAIRARLEGFLEGIHFKEGSEVSAGDLLYTIESQPFEADVAAKMSKVAEAKTMLAKADSDLKRYRPLAARKAVSQSDLDSAVAQYEAAKASVEAAKANLKASKIQLSYTKVYSPIDGIIGKTKAKVGDFVGREPNPVILNTVSNTETILVDFFLTENQYLTFARRYLAKHAEQGAAVNKKENSQIKNPAPEKSTSKKEKSAEKTAKQNTRQETIDQGPPLELILSDGSHYPHKGKGEFLDREVDPATGAILVQASFPNPDGLIRPGQFAKVKTKIDDVKDGILVPQRCVSELQGMTRVFVVDDQNKVQERKVETGPTVDNFWLISDGLKPGEKVIYEGLQKVADGAVVKPVVKEVERITQDGQ